MSAATLALYAVWRREYIRFIRQPNRIIGAIGPPVLIWLFVGSGFGASFQLAGGSGVGYLEYLLPGIVALIVLFASIFSAMSVIEDRRDGFLDGTLVTPAPRGSVVGGKIAGGSSQAFAQGALLVLAAPFAISGLGAAPVVLALGVLALVAFGLTAFGCAMAWRMDSTQGYHSIMNLLLMPMWLLSGAVFPLDGAPVVMRLLMLANPMTYAVAALRAPFYMGSALAAPGPIGFPLALGVTAGFAAAMATVAAVMASRPARS
jgi:ABC-2 type transport system permease protein